MIQDSYIGTDLRETGLSHIAEVFEVISEDFLSNGGPAVHADRQFIGGSRPTIADFAIAPLFQLLDATDIETLGLIEDYENRFNKAVPFAAVCSEGGQGDEEIQVGIVDVIARKNLKSGLEERHKSRTGRKKYSSQHGAKKKPPQGLTVPEFGRREVPSKPSTTTLFMNRMSVNCHGPWAVLHQLQERLGGDLDGETYKIHDINLVKGETRTPQFLGMNRAHCIPTLLDTDGTVIYESHAIMRYLQNSRCPGEYVCCPPHCKEMVRGGAICNARIDMGLDWKASTLQPMVERLAYPMLSLAKATTREVTQNARDSIMDMFDVLYKHLLQAGQDRFIGGGPYPSIADISVVACLRLLRVDKELKFPEEIEDYIHHVRNFVPYLDSLDGGDGKYGLDDLIANVERTGLAHIDDPLHIQENREKHRLTGYDNLMDDA